MTFLCVFCWSDDGDDVEAVTLLNGCAVCRFHVDRAAGLIRFTAPQADERRQAG